MIIKKSVVIGVCFASVATLAAASSAGHSACEKQFRERSKQRVLSVPVVPDNGDSREYYFAWNNGSLSSPIQTKSGPASGSCIIDRRSGQGSLTLNKKDLGTFRVKAPL